LTRLIIWAILEDNMWDPISIFACMWALNADLPEARLNVHKTIEANEQRIFIEQMHKDVTIREGV